MVMYFVLCILVLFRLGTFPTDFLLRGTTAILWSFQNHFFPIFSSCKCCTFIELMEVLGLLGALDLKVRDLPPWLNWTGSEEIELIQIESDLNLLLTGWQFMFVPPDFAFSWVYHLSKNNFLGPTLLNTKWAWDYARRHLVNVCRIQPIQQMILEVPTSYPSGNSNT